MTQAIHRRCERSGARAIGARIVGRFIAEDSTACGCCGCVIEAGEFGLDAIRMDGVPIVVCSNCAAQP
jgi:hypothetical protein